MFLAAMILIVSTALFFFYLQAVCQKILRRKFEQEFFLAIVNANRLEFPAVRKSLEEFDVPVDYARLRMMLKCDFLALTYLLKNAANSGRSFSHEERLLILYFRWAFLTFVARHFLRLREKAAVLKMTAILQYFANVVGQRVNSVRFGSLAATDYLLNL